MARPGVGYRDETKQTWVCKECGEAHTLFTTELEYEQEQRARIAHQPLPIALAAGASLTGVCKSEIIATNCPSTSRFPPTPE